VSQHPNISFAALEPLFVRYEKNEKGTFQIPCEMSECMGVRFSCPLCYANNGMSLVGTHSVVCWSETLGAPPEATPGPGRWMLSGTGIKDLTLTGDKGRSNSVWLQGGCGWHGFIENGIARSA